MRRLTVVAILLAAACASGIEADLVIGADEDELRTFAPLECASGEPLEFFGVDLWDEADRFLRFVHFPIDGPALLYFEPRSDVESIRVHPEDCREFSGELQRTDVAIDGVWAMKGELHLDCRAPDGGIIRGWMRFSDCAAHNNDYSD